MSDVFALAQVDERHQEFLAPLRDVQGNEPTQNAVAANADSDQKWPELSDKRPPFHAGENVSKYDTEYFFQWRRVNIHRCETKLD